MVVSILISFQFYGYLKFPTKDRVYEDDWYLDDFHNVISFHCDNSALLSTGMNNYLHTKIFEFWNYIIGKMSRDGEVMREQIACTDENKVLWRVLKSSKMRLYNCTYGLILYWDKNIFQIFWHSYIKIFTLASSAHLWNYFHNDIF